MENQIFEKVQRALNCFLETSEAKEITKMILEKKSSIEDVENRIGEITGLKDLYDIEKKEWAEITKNSIKHSIEEIKYWKGE